MALWLSVHCTKATHTSNLSLIGYHEPHAHTSNYLWSEAQSRFDSHLQTTYEGERTINALNCFKIPVLDGENSWCQSMSLMPRDARKCCIRNFELLGSLESWREQCRMIMDGRSTVYLLSKGHNLKCKDCQLVTASENRRAGSTYIRRQSQLVLLDTFCHE